MLITITDLAGVTGRELNQWRTAKFALCIANKMIVSLSQEGACQALNTPGGPAGPTVREPTLDELRAWFHWQAEHGRTNQRFIEAGLPYPADD